MRRRYQTSRYAAMFKLASDWRCILKRAWSLRLGALALVLSGLEMVLPLFIDDIPRWVFAGLTFVVVAAAMWARLVWQGGMR